MFGIVAFILVLAIVYALKALSIAKTRDGIVSKSTVFSWSAVRAQDAQQAQTAPTAPSPSSGKTAARVQVLHRRPNAA